MYKQAMPLTRKIIFYSFVLIYLIICPIIILRMLGFVWDNQTHAWIKTGIIYASSNPPDAHVFINGKMLLETTPAIIRDLTPDIYSIKIELDGYEPWENTVPVVDKKASSIENILLIPKQWRIKTLNAEPLQKLIAIPNNDYLLVAADNIIQNIFILRLSKEMEDHPQESTRINPSNLEPLLPEESIYRDGRLIRFFTITPSPFFVMEIVLGDKHKYIWVDPREKPAHIEDISDLLPQSPSKLSWEPNDEKNIFAFYDNTVNRVNIKAKAIYPNIDEKDIPIPKKQSKPNLSLPEADQVFLINNDNTLLFRKGKKIYLKDTESFGIPRLRQFLTVEDKTDVFFSERTGKLYFIDAQSDFLSSIQILHHKPFIPKPIAETLRLNKLEK